MDTDSRSEHRPQEVGEDTGSRAVSGRHPRAAWPELNLRPSRDLACVPEGAYDARACWAEAKPSVAGERRLFIWFEILGGSADGVRLFMACRIPRNGRPAPSSKIYKAWTTANGGQPPRRHDRMSPKIFANRLFRVRVVTVTKDYNGKLLPNPQRYSVVAEVVP